MLRDVLVIVTLLGTGILIGYLLSADSGHNQAHVHTGPAVGLPAVNPLDVPATDSESISVLQAELRRESQAREQLETKVQVLLMRVEELEHLRQSEHTTPVPAVNSDAQGESTAAVQSSLQALIAAGIREDQAAWIQEQLDQIELQKLYLRDRATREGWLNKPRYHKERRKYQNVVPKLRGEIGDDAYDRLLYVLGRVNRVAIRDILQNSPAAQYGLQAGDRIIEYDGQRVFTSTELSTLVTEGGAGVMTLLRVDRGGSMQDIYVPRGPLGIRMAAARVAP